MKHSRGGYTHFVRHIAEGQNFFGGGGGGGSAEGGYNQGSKIILASLPFLLDHKTCLYTVASWLQAEVYSHSL